VDIIQTCTIRCVIIMKPVFDVEPDNEDCAVLNSWYCSECSFNEECEVAVYDKEGN